jgi:hypothetical protein
LAQVNGTVPSSEVKDDYLPNRSFELKGAVR